MADPLETALSEAFSTSAAPETRPDLGGKSPDNLEPVQETFTPTAPTPAAPVAPSQEVETSKEDVWKADYEAHLGRWREESAEGREKAEKTRQHWEEMRASGVTVDDLDGEQRIVETETTSSRLTSSWATFDSKPASHDMASSAPSDKPPCAETSTSIHAKENTGDEMKWENVASETTSSYPSLTFPEPSNTPPRPAPQSAPPISATMAIFDSDLSPRTRVVAVLSAMAINFLLPFVNGVMLGFGEIFAKNIIGERWLGWKIGPLITNRPGSAAASAGIRTQTTRKER